MNRIDVCSTSADALIGFEQDRRLLNQQDLEEGGKHFAKLAVQITAGRLRQAQAAGKDVYQPVGYVVSEEKLKADREDGKLEKALEARDAVRKRDRRRIIAG